MPYLGASASTGHINDAFAEYDKTFSADALTRKSTEQKGRSSSYSRGEPTRSTPAPTNLSSRKRSGSLAGSHAPSPKRPRSSPRVSAPRAEKGDASSLGFPRRRIAAACISTSLPGQRVGCRRPLHIHGRGWLFATLIAMGTNHGGSLQP